MFILSHPISKGQFWGQEKGAHKAALLAKGVHKGVASQPGCPIQKGVHRGLTKRVPKEGAQSIWHLGQVVSRPVLLHPKMGAPGEDITPAENLSCAQRMRFLLREFLEGMDLCVTKSWKMSLSKSCTVKDVSSTSPQCVDEAQPDLYVLA